MKERGSLDPSSSFYGTHGRGGWAELPPHPASPGEGPQRGRAQGLTSKWVTMTSISSSQKGGLA